MPAAYHGQQALVGALKGRDARATALARADFDANGTPDVVTGYAWRGAGIVTVQKGNTDAFAPTRQSVFRRIHSGYDPASLVERAGAYHVPEAVSYVEAGDFNRDGLPDVLAAARGGGLYLLAGDGSGGFGEAHKISLPGTVTTLTSGEFRAADGHPDVAVGVTTKSGPALLVYDGGRGFAAKPVRFALPGNATSIQIGGLDTDPYQDLAVAAGGRLEIIHGWGRKHSPTLGSRVEQVRTSGVQVLAIGHFIKDRAGLNEIAAVYGDGAIRLVVPKSLDTRPLTPSEARARSRARLHVRRVTDVDTEALPAWSRSGAPGWRIGRAIERGVALGHALPQHLLTTANVSQLESSDLLVADGVHGLHIVRARISTRTSRSLAAASRGFRMARTDATAVLALPVQVNGERPIVSVGGDGSPGTLILAAGSSITVDRADDPSGAGLTAASACTAAANDCSLRGAIQFANANAGSTINVPDPNTIGGSNHTYVLSIQGANGCVFEPAATGNTIGDLELNTNTTISGAGAANTIIRQSGTNDRVLCLNVTLAADIQQSISGVTITGGRDTQFGGGGIVGGDLNNTLALTGVVVSNNQTTGHLTPSGGGGIVYTGGSLTITNSTIGGTSDPCSSCTAAQRADSSLGNWGVGVSGGGIEYTPSSPGHTGGTGTLTVTGSTFSHNFATGIGGGGFDVETLAFAAPGGIGSGSASVGTSTFSNNQASNGGGIQDSSLDTTIATSSFTSNAASNRGGAAYVGGGINGLTLNGTSPSVTMTGNTATSAGSTISTAYKVTVLGTNVTLGGDIEMSFGGNWTNSAGSVITPNNVVLNGGSFTANNSTTNITGNFSFSGGGTFNAGTGVFNFSGSGTQNINGPNSATFNTLQVNKPSGAVNVNVGTSVASDLTVTSGTLDAGGSGLNRTALGGTMTVANGATFKTGGNFPTNYATVSLGASSTVDYESIGTQTISAQNYGNLTSSTSAPRVLPSGQTVGIAGTFTPGASPFTTTGSTVDFNGSAAQTIPALSYFNLTSSSTGSRTLASSGTIGVGAAFTPGTNAYTVTGSTMDFNSSAPQTIPAFNYNNLTSSSTGGRTLSGTVGVAGTFTPGSNVYTVGGSTMDFNGTSAQTIPAFNYDSLTSSSSGARTLASSGTIGVASTFTPGSNSYTTAGSTVNFNGSGAQTIPAIPYNNLTSSSSGARTLASSGTIGVAGTFTPGSNTYTNTGSTLDFNGSGAQAIPAFNYNNLTSSSTGARTLASSGTVGVAGTFTPGTNAYTTTGSTVNFNGSGAQTIPALLYNNLTSSSTGARTLASSGTIGVAGAFTPGTNSYTVTGSTMSFNGSGAQTIPAFTFNNLNDANTAATVALSGAVTATNLVVNSNALLDTTTFLLTLPGAYSNNGQIRHSLTQSLGSTTGPFTFADGVGVETLRLSGLNTPFGSTAFNTAAGGTNPYNSCGALPANAIKRFWQVTPATTGSGTARFSFRDNEVTNGSLGFDRYAIYRCLSSGGAWAQVGTTYTKPAPGGPASGFSTVEATAVPFSSVGATYVLAQGTPDLTVSKTNNTGSAITVGHAWTWTLHVDNTGTDNATWGVGQTILSDNLPNSNIAYSTAAVANIGSGVTGGTISCSIASSDLTCVAAGAAVVLSPTNGSFDVTLDATASAVGTYANPRGGGSCTVDPNNNNTETNEGNNSCSNSVVVSKADTTAAITSDSPDPSVTGQSVTVQYTVTPTGSGTPTGNVTVTDGTDSCTATVAAGQCAISFTSRGAKSLTATYAGDSNFNASPASSPSTAHTVNKADTTASITSDSPDPSSVGQSVTVQYSVAANAPGGGTPTGNVTVTDGTQSCTATVSAGQCTISFSSSGSKSLTATYAGDSNFNASAASSPATSHTVNGTPTTSTITSDSPDPSVVGQSVTVQYTVTSGGGTPTGDVTVSDGTDSCTATVAAGQCTVSFTSRGSKSLTATYAGDSQFAGSTSATASHTVDKADTTATIVADGPDPSVAFVQPVTVQYTVAANAPGAGTPTGNVTVSDGVDSCTGTAAAGQCSVAFSTPGTRTITATYVGDSNFNGSISSSVSHDVHAAAIGFQVSTPVSVGTSFNVKATMKDAITGATVTGFNGPLSWSDLSGTLSPAPNNFVNGVSQTSASVSVAFNGDRISGTAAAGNVSGQSGAFNVLGAFAKIAFTLATPVSAGAPFTVTANAQDSAGNNLNTYNGPATWSDLSGGLSPATPNDFVNGVSQTTATIASTYHDDKITLVSGAITGSSALFNVIGGLSFIDIKTAVQPVSAGVSVTVTATAQDSSGNKLNSYNGPATWSDLSGSISPAAPNDFVNGVSQTTATITTPFHNDKITVVSGGVTSPSAAFNVVGPFSKIGFKFSVQPVTSGVPFTLTATAQDSAGNKISSYNGTATWSDLSGGLSPATPNDFVNGVSTTTTTIPSAFHGDKVTIVSGGVTSVSAMFNVL